MTGLSPAQQLGLDKLLVTPATGLELANTIVRLMYELGVTRLTALRAGYLDNVNQVGLLQLTAARALLLDQITALRMAELDAANLPADTDTLLARLTALRAGYLDNINQAGLLQLTAARAALLDNLLGVVSTVGSPFSLVNNVLEQDVIIVAAATQLVDIELDVNALTQNNTIREYVQVDAVNYRQISAKVFPTNFDTGTKAITLSFPQKNALYKVTMQASVLEGIARDIPWRQLRRDLV